MVDVNDGKWYRWHDEDDRNHRRRWVVGMGAATLSLLTLVRFFFAQVYFEDCFDLCCLSSSSVLVRHGTGKLMTGYKTRKQMALLRSDRGRNLAQRLSVASLAESNLGKTRETSMGTRHTAIIHDSLKQECMCTKCTRQNGQLNCRDIVADCNQGMTKGPSDVYVKCVSFVFPSLVETL